MRRDETIMAENLSLKQLLRSEKSKRKKEFRTLLNTIKDLNKTIKRLKAQEIFLNELLDKREAEIKCLKEDLHEQESGK